MPLGPGGGHRGTHGRRRSVFGDSGSQWVVMRRCVLPPPRSPCDETTISSVSSMGLTKPGRTVRSPDAHTLTPFSFGEEPRHRLRLFIVARKPVRGGAQ